MTLEEHKRLYELIQNPPPGSKIEAAKKFGIDLTLTLHNLTLTPTERIEQMEADAGFAEMLQRAHSDSPRRSAASQDALIRSQRSAKGAKDLYLLHELEALKEMYEVLKSIPTEN